VGGSDGPSGRSVVWIAEREARETSPRAHALAGEHAVDHCAATAALLERLGRGERPDALVVDGELPGAEELLRALRRRWTALELPIVVLGPRQAAPAATARWLDAGANDHAGEPLDPVELRARVAALVRLGRLYAARPRQTPGRGDVWYRALTQHFPNGGVFLFDRELRFLIADGEGMRAAGWHRDAIVGKQLQEVLQPAMVTQLEPHYRAALAGEARTFEVHSNGRLHRTLTAPVCDESGRIVAGLAMSQDVTREREVVEALRRSQEELQETIEKLPDALALRRGDRLLWVNPAWMAALGGATRGSFVGKSLCELVHPDDRERLSARLGASDDGVEPLRFVRGDGQIALLELGEIHTLRFGGVPAVLSVARDVPARARKAPRLRLADRAPA
jgi:PAS domain-containing protein